MRACRVVWTGRCRCGSCVCWGNVVWPASSPGQPSDSASYSGPPLLVFPAGVGMDNSLLSPLCERRGEMGRWAKSLECHRQVITKVTVCCFAFFVSSTYKMEPLPSTSEVPPGSIDASPSTASLVACVTGDEILWGQLRCHVTHRLDGDSVWCHSWWRGEETLQNVRPKLLQFVSSGSYSMW